MWNERDDRFISFEVVHVLEVGYAYPACTNDELFRAKKRNAYECRMPDAGCRFPVETTLDPYREIPSTFAGEIGFAKIAEPSWRSGTHRVCVTCLRAAARNIN